MNGVESPDDETALKRGGRTLPATVLTQKELIARAEDLISAWNQRDVDRIVSAFDPAVSFRDIARLGDLTGREAVRADAESLLAALPDLELKVLRTVAAGSVVAQEWVIRGRGRSVQRAGVTIADYDLMGRIARFTRYWNAPGLAARRSVASPARIASARPRSPRPARSSR